MTGIEERPSIGERYSAAIESSNLKLGERRSDVDYLIASAKVEDGLGATLYRLMREFDSVRGPVDAAKRWVAEQSKIAADMRDAAASFAADPEHDREAHKKMVKAADGVQQAAITSMRTEFVLVLSVMKTLREARYAIAGFAVEESRKRNIDIQASDLMSLVGRVIDIMLDPLCHPCEGRGYTGGGRHEQTGPQVICRPCRGSGHRRDAIGKTDTERLFASHLLMQLDASLSTVEAQIRSGLRAVDEAKSWIAEQGAAL